VRSWKNERLNGMNSTVTTLQKTRPFLPVRLLNGCGALLGKTRIPPGRVRAVDLIETAKQRCGSDDFGKDDFFEALSRLLESCHSEAQLNLIGKIALRTNVLHTLSSALSGNRTAGNPRTTPHHRPASQRHHFTTHSARCRSGPSLSSYVGSDDAIAAHACR